MPFIPQCVYIQSHTGVYGYEFLNEALKVERPYTLRDLTNQTVGKYALVNLRLTMYRESLVDVNSTSVLLASCRMHAIFVFTST